MNIEICLKKHRKNVFIIPDKQYFLFKMTKSQKLWLIIGPTLFSFNAAIVNPVISVYFMRLFDPQLIAISNTISVGAGAITNASITKRKFIEFYDKYFKFIVVFDVLCFVSISIIGMEMPALRLIGLTLISSISTTIWGFCIKNSINNVVAGTELTMFSALTQSYELYATFAGGIVILLLGDLDINIAITIQCFSNLFLGITDLKAKSLLAQK